MNRSLIGFCIFLAAVVFLWYYLSDGTWAIPTMGPEATTSASSAVVPAKATAPKAPVKTPTGTGTGNTYKSLLTQSGSYECDYSQVQPTGQTNNVIYIYGGKLRGEFRTVSGNVTGASLVVYDGHYLYSWTEGKTSGTRTVLTSLSQLPSVIPTDLTSGTIYGSNYNSVGWNCHNWLTNPSILIPPSYVTFNSK